MLLSRPLGKTLIPPKGRGLFSIHTKRKKSKMSKKNVQALCPVCGSSHGYRYKPSQRKGYVRLGDPENYWEQALAKYDIDKPFGIEFGTGKAGLANWNYLDIQDASVKPFLRPIAGLVLKAIERLVTQGLIGKADIELLLKNI